MLHLLDEQLGRIGSFKTYNEVVDFIHEVQTYRLTYINTRDYPLVVPLDHVKSRWRFVYYKHSELTIIYSCMKEPPINGIERQAFEMGLDLIEIYQGDAKNPLQTPVTADLNIQKLHKDWCESCCKTYGYTLLETFGNESLSELPTTGGGSDLVV